MRRIRRREGRPAVLYVHPWEFDPDQPVVPAGRLTTFRHRVNLDRSASRLEALFGRFEFAPFSRVVESLGGPAVLPVVDLGAARVSGVHPREVRA
jgi:hypothetical protein